MSYYLTSDTFKARAVPIKQTEDELTKEADSGIIYLEVDGTNIHLQQEEKTKAELKLGIISKGKERIITSLC